MAVHDPLDRAGPTTTTTEVGCSLGFDVTEPGELALQVAPATGAGHVLVEEELEVTDAAGRPVPVREVAVDHGGRVHVLAVPLGALDVSYRAVLRTPPPTEPAPLVGEAAAMAFLRPSRYCPSDVLAGWATAELGTVASLGGAGSAARAVASWVFERLAYAPGVSRGTDSAIETLLGGAGVCRDFGHLTIAACRALGVPARLASAYAPGLSPMDFHAVVEVAVEGRWEVLDPTRLAPRPSLVRIATGRDAADTAFASTLAGDAELTRSEVFASTDRSLDADDHRQVARLA